MPPYEVLITIVLAIFGSGGFWAFITQIINSRSIQHKMLLGLCFERLIEKCEHYIDQGWVPIEEYEDLVTYLYNPYIESGGNGTAEALMKKVSHLPNTKSN